MPNNPKPPTDAEIAKLQAALDKARDRHLAAINAAHAAEQRARRQHEPKVSAAEMAQNEASLALATAKLAQKGITPLRTVIRYQGDVWAVRLTPDGFRRLIPLKADLSQHMGRKELMLPVFRNCVIEPGKEMKR
jgi:uncharacterized protein (DUF1501 family)